jgi:RNA polymerase sigma factor (sigma-70 family)
VHEAEELVQEALLRAYTHREQLLTEEDLSAWTTVVTGRLVIDRLRVRGRSTSVANVPEGYRVSRDTADIVVAKDEARTALDALDAMPARQASLLWAREVEGHSYEQLCVRFSMTEPAVRSVLTRARKALRREYALRGGTLPVGGLAVLAPWIAGLTRLEKLRRLATRATAPAALGAVAVTTLGGLILSPLGIGAIASGGSYRPTQAVVSSATPPAAAVTGLNVASTSPARPALRPASADKASDAPRRSAKPGLLDGRGCHSVQGGGSQAAGAGSYRCTPREDPPATVVDVQLPVTLPSNPFGVNNHVNILSDIPCERLPSNSIAHCTTGASR